MMMTKAQSGKIVNYVMANGDVRPLLVVRGWNFTPPVPSNPSPQAQVTAPGERVKFASHGLDPIEVVACVNGILFIDPGIDAGNLPVFGTDKDAHATLVATAERGKADDATAEEKRAAKDAQGELRRLDQPKATPTTPITEFANGFQVWIDATNYDAGKAPGTWHTPVGQL